MGNLYRGIADFLWFKTGLLLLQEKEVAVASTGAGYAGTCTFQFVVCFIPPLYCPPLVSINIIYFDCCSINFIIRQFDIAIFYSNDYIETIYLINNLQYIIYPKYYSGQGYSTAGETVIFLLEGKCYLKPI